MWHSLAARHLQKTTRSCREKWVFPTKQDSISNVDCLHQLNINKKYWPNESVVFLHECSSLFRLWLWDVWYHSIRASSLQLQTKRVLTGIFIVCLNFSNSRHKARLWVHINASYYRKKSVFSPRTPNQLSLFLYQLTTRVLWVLINPVNIVHCKFPVLPNKNNKKRTIITEFTAVWELHPKLFSSH